MARPREFDVDEALRRAMTLFWARGYEGVSLAELAAVMGINKPSLYAAFGDKEALFRKAVELYDTTTGRLATQALEEASTAREAIERVLRLNASDYAATDRPAGCMIVLAATVGAVENELIREYLAQCRREGEAALRRRIALGVTEGELPESVEAENLARFYNSVLQGMSIQARDGATSAQLNLIADAAMAAWPKRAPMPRRSTRRSGPTA